MFGQVKVKVNSNSKKPFCKVCFDSGKTEEEYTSHYVKSNIGPKSDVICPTLLSLECSFCHVKGHTKRHCSMLKNVIKEESRYRSRKFFDDKQESLSKGKGKGKLTNVFECLDSSGEDEKDEKDEEECVEDFPALAPPSVYVTKPCMSYVAMAMTMKRECEVQVVEKEVRFKVKSQMKSWADYDSESDIDVQTDDEY
jgi:hypothetical protein